MFTGLVEELGTVRAVIENAAFGGFRRHDRGDTPRPPGGARLEIEAVAVLDDATLGASIAVNGCCLTAVELGEGWWAADVVEETLRRTSLGALTAGDRVNLERPVRLSDRLGGHIVQGHVDGVGTVATVEEDGFARRVRVELAPELLRYAVDRGSITLNGVSLTVAELGESWVEVSLIPETLERTNFGLMAPGDRVNVESDVVAKYVERLLAPFAGKD